jgi:predicted GIY-YIG superfamily endonuclease
MVDKKLDTLEKLDTMDTLEKLDTMDTIEKWYCYILKNNYEPHKNRTYNGKTNNPIRRLKEHNQNGPQTKGAVYTRTWGNKSWEFIMIMGYLPSDKEALRHEWRIKKPEGKSRNKNKKYIGPGGRIKGLNYALGLERFTSNCENAIKDMKLNIWILKEYRHLLEDRPDYLLLNIIECDTINNEFIELSIMN